MTLTLEIAPEDRRALEVPAQANGQSVEEYLAALAHHAARVAPHVTAAPERAAAAARLAAMDDLDALVKSLPANRAGLPELNTSRTAETDIYGYGEREDKQL